MAPAAETHVYSAYPPLPLGTPLLVQATRSPACREQVSPDPTATMVPSPSKPRIPGLENG